MKVRSWKLEVGSVLIFVFSSLVLAETNDSISSGTITLVEVLKLAERNNPEILASQKKWEATTKRIVQAATLEKPRLDIERMYSKEGESIVTGAEEKNITISQEVPFPTTLYLRGKIASKEAEKAHLDYQATILGVLAQTRRAYAMLFFSNRALELFSENTELMRQFAKIAETKYAVGHGSQSDVLRAQVELSKMLNMLVTLNQEKETSQAMLNTLLNRSPRAPLGQPDGLPVKKLGLTLDELENLALRERPELESARVDFEKSKSNIHLARSEYLPDIMFLYRRRNSMTASMDNTQDAMIGFSIPLWFWKQRAMVAEAKAEKEMAQAEYQAQKNMTAYQVKNLLVKLQTTERLIELYKTSVLPQAQEALKIAESAYQSGKLDFLDLIDSQRSLLEFRFEYYQYLAEYESQFGEIERLAGRSL